MAERSLADLGRPFVDMPEGGVSLADIATLYHRHKAQERPSAGQEKFSRIVDAISRGLRHWFETPGRAYREGIDREEAADWGAGTALGMIGIGTPAGMLGPAAVGAAGGKLVAGAAGASAIADDIRAALRQVIEANDGHHYGLRVSEGPLKIGETAPPSKQFYADFIADNHPVFGREAFPDHLTDLPGTSVMGIRKMEDVEAALRSAGVLPMDWSKPGPGSYESLGPHISLLRSDKRQIGHDPGEWLLPNAEVVSTWKK